MTVSPPPKEQSTELQFDMFPSPPAHPQCEDLPPQLHFAMSSPPISPPLQQVPPIPLQSPPAQPQLQHPRTPPPIYTPRPTPAHFHVIPTSPNQHAFPIEHTSPTAHPSPRERLTRFAPVPVPTGAPTTTAPSLLPSTAAPQSLFPTELPPRPAAAAPTYTSYFGFYALPRPFIAARPRTPRGGASVPLRTLSGQRRGRNERDLGAEEAGGRELVDVRGETGIDGSRRRYVSGIGRRRAYMRWMRKRNISLVLTVIIIVVLFWILIGVGMGRKHDGSKEGESKVVT